MSACSKDEQLQILSKVGSELDSLITEMKRENPFEKSKEPQSGLTDNISSAFDAISNELQELDSMIENNGAPAVPEENVYFRNPKSEHEFIKSIGDLSEDVEKNLSIAREHSMHRQELDKQNRKTELLAKLKEKYKEIAKVLEGVGAKSAHRTAVVSLLKDVTSIYKEYVGLSSLIDGKMNSNLTQLEKKIDEAQHKDVEITEILTNFYKFDGQFKQEIPSKEKEMKEINNYLTKIGQLDQTNMNIKQRILIHLEYLRNNHSDLKYSSWLKLQAKYLGMVQKLITMNDEVIQTKETIMDYLKKNDVLRLDSLQQMTDNSKYSSVVETSKRLIGNQANIHKIRDKISENVSKTSEVLGHKGALGEFKVKVAEVLEKIKAIKELREETQERSTLAKKLIENNRQMSNVYAQIEIYKEELKKHQENQVPKSKILHIEAILGKLRELIDHSKQALKLIGDNKQNRLNASSQYKSMIGNLEKLKTTITNREVTSKLAPEKLQQLVKTSHLEVKKLTHLYKYIKEGSVHNYVHNQVLRKLVNLNSSVLTDIDLKKLQLSLKLTT